MNQTNVKQAHLNGSGFMVLGRNRVRGISFTGSATAGFVALFDTTTAPVTTATYGRSGATVTVTQSAHGLATGDVIGIGPTDVIIQAVLSPTVGTVTAGTVQFTIVYAVADSTGAQSPSPSQQ